MEEAVEKVVLENQQVDLELAFYGGDDMETLSLIYRKWVELSDLIQKNGGRRINIPELLSEAIFCFHFKAGRVLKGNSKINTSFDCLTIDPVRRIQVKSCSVEYDLTSFGPKSVWDDIYFVHLFPNGSYDGSYKIYKIENDLIYNHKVNANHTFADQQKLNRRPRFSLMKELIIPRGIEPIIEDSLTI